MCVCSRGGTGGHSDQSEGRVIRQESAVTVTQRQESIIIAAAEHFQLQGDNVQLETAFKCSCWRGHCQAEREGGVVCVGRGELD